MSRTYEYRSGLASQISAFIAEKRACGCKYEKEAKTFQTLDRFLVEQGINTPVLPELVVEKWIEKRPNEKRKNQKWRLNFTKRFAKYLQLNGYAAYYPELTMEMSRNVQSGNTQNLKSMVIQRSFPKWSVAERRKTAAASNQAACCACTHSRYLAGGSPSGLRV